MPCRDAAARPGHQCRRQVRRVMPASVDDAAPRILLQRSNHDRHERRRIEMTRRGRLASICAAVTACTAFGHARSASSELWRTSSSAYTLPAGRTPSSMACQRPRTTAPRERSNLFNRDRVARRAQPDNLVEADLDERRNGFDAASGANLQQAADIAVVRQQEVAAIGKATNLQARRY